MRYKLGEIFEVGSGGTPSKSHPEYYGGSIPWIKTGDLKCEYLYEAEDYITESGLSNSSAKMYEPDTVLIAMYGATIGATSILKIDACTNQACAAFKKSEKVLPEYLYYFFKSQKERFVKDGVGGAQPNISAGYLKNVEMEVPLLEKQSEIVSVLDKINRIIDERKIELEELDNLIKSRFVEMFGDPMINPFNFPVKTIEDVAYLNKGITYSPEDVTDDGMIVLRSSNIKGNKFDLADLVKITKIVSAEKYVQENDILMCNRNGSARLVGKVAKIPKLDENMTFGTFMTIVRSDIFEYLFVFFQLDAFREQIKFQTAVAINQISLPLLAAVKVPVPPKELIDEFAMFVTQVDKLKFEVQKSLNETQTLMNSLMQQYFG